MTVNLAPARRAVEGLMDDQCVITRDAQGTRDDLLNETTLEAARPAGEPTTVYTGKCKVRPDLRGQQTVEAGQPRTVVPYIGGIPVAAPESRPGDLLKITSSLRDPLLVGKRFRVIEPLAKTFAVQRGLRLELRLDTKDRP